jgi:RNA polymerase-binding transcription factor DksA
MNPTVARQRLQAERERLLAARSAIDADGLDVQTEDESVSELSPIDQHQADVASETFEREKEFSIRDQIDRDLQAVDDAFRQLEAGHYGRCETCAEPIPDERLDALPMARFCLDHERAWELRTLSVPVPDVQMPDGGQSAELIALHEAIQHFEFLPTDDAAEPELVLSAEEAALHREATDDEPAEAMEPEELELAETMKPSQ